MKYHLGEFRPAPDLIGPVLRAMERGPLPSGGDRGARSASARARARSNRGPSTRALLTRIVGILAQWDHSPTSVLEELLGAGGEGDFFGTSPRRLTLELASESRELERAPDMLTALELSEVDRRWTRELYEELACWGPRRAGLRILECSHVAGPRGHVAVAGINHLARHDVRPGDSIISGFAALRPAGDVLRIHPRIYRVVCTNGMILHEATGEDELEREGGVGAAIEHCLSSALVEKSVRRLRGAARTPVADPLELLSRVAARCSSATDDPRLTLDLIEERPGAHGSSIDLGPPLRPRIRAEWEASDDRSLFAAVNAVTAVARAEQDFRRRLALEGLAGHMLDLGAAHAPLRASSRLIETSLSN